MVRLFLFCCLLITSFVRADTIHVYCDDWPGFCHRDGKGVYLDVVRAIYEPLGHEVKLHMVPYKRALAVVSQKEGDMAMGVYRGEVPGVHQPDYPDSADYVSVVMQKRWLPHWAGEHSLKEQEVLWLRGWAFDKFIPEPMRWFEIDSHEMALQLLIKGRYRYYLTDGALYPEGQAVARALGSRHAHPDKAGQAGGDLSAEQALRLLPGLSQGAGGAGEQVTALAVGPDAVIGPLLPCLSLWGSERLGQPVVIDNVLSCLSLWL